MWLRFAELSLSLSRWRSFVKVNQAVIASNTRRADGADGGDANVRII